MFSKDPSELMRKEKMDDEEIVRSIRLALAAELDAINFYMQQSKIMPDGHFKKVHEDIAREEVTHFGEFMRLLYEYSPEDFTKIRQGWDEASGILEEKADMSLDMTPKAASNSGTLEKSDSEETFLTDIGFDHQNWHQDSIRLPDEPDRLYPLTFLAVGYSVRKDSSEEMLLMEREKARRELQVRIMKTIMTEHDLSLQKRSIRISGSDWSKTGNITNDASEAYRKLAENGYSSDISVLVDPKAFKMLQREVSGTGQIEMELLKTITDKIEMSPYLPDNSILLFHRKSFKILVQSGIKNSMVSQDVDRLKFSLTIKLAPLIYDRNSAIFVEAKGKS